MEEKIKEIMSSVFEVQIDEITEETQMQDVNSWDSLMHMEMILEIETEFGLKLSPDDITKMTSFKDILNIIQKYTG